MTTHCQGRGTITTGETLGPMLCHQGWIKSSGPLFLCGSRRPWAQWSGADLEPWLLDTAVDPVPGSWTLHAGKIQNHSVTTRGWIQSLRPFTWSGSGILWL